MLVTLATFSSCEKDEVNDRENDWEKEVEAMEKISVGEPFFTVTPGTIGNIVRIAWTGEKLWAITDIGGGDIPQKLLEIDTSDGSIIQSIPFYEPNNPTKQMVCLDYANGKLGDIRTHVIEGEQKYAKTYDIETGEGTGQWTYSGNYYVYDYFTFDGSYYWGKANFNCDGYNCQALVSYETNGNINKIFDLRSDEGNLYNYYDLVYGGGYLWAYQKAYSSKIIRKLDANLNILESYNITDSEKFGEEQFGNEIAVHLEYINGTLWIVDRFNNFYKTTIQ